jgi:hypothetical protein
VRVVQTKLNFYKIILKSRTMVQQRMISNCDWYKMYRKL